MTSFHPFSSWKEVGSDFQTSFWWLWQQSLSPAHDYDFVAESGQQRNWAGWKAILILLSLKQNQSCPDIRTGPTGSIIWAISTFINILSKLPPGPAPWQVCLKYRPDFVKAPGRLLDTNTRKKISWGHLDKKVLGRPKREYVYVHVCTSCRYVFGCIPPPYFLLKMYKYGGKT